LKQTTDAKQLNKSFVNTARRPQLNRPRRFIEEHDRRIVNQLQSNWQPFALSSGQVSCPCVVWVKQT